MDNNDYTQSADDSQCISSLAGVALGGAIAKDNQRRANPQRYYASLEDRCGINTKWQEIEQIVAWDVVYEYHGETYDTRMREQPGV